MGKYGWIPQQADSRDFQAKLLHPSAIASMPSHVWPLSGFSDAWDQSQIGSCTGHGVGASWHHRMHAESKGAIIPSRLFIYWLARQMEGTTGTDSGAMVRDAFKVLIKFGAPHESQWPYDISKFTIQPPQAAYTAALKDIALQYAAVPVDVDSIRQSLAAKTPVVGGFWVKPSFESSHVAATGIYQPTDGERTIGGHCVLIDGYDDVKGVFWCRNSWGQAFGAQIPNHPARRGWFTVPMDRIKKDWSDLWILTKVA